MYAKSSLHKTRYKYRVLIDGSIFDQEKNKVIALLSWSDKEHVLDMTKKEQQEWLEDYLKN